MLPDPRLPVRVGFVGAGGVALRHAAAAATVDEISVVAVADPDRAAAARVAAAAGATGAATYPDLTALLADRAVDLVALLVPPGPHAALTERVAAAGRHVLVEKPMAPTVAECDRMTAACAAAGVTLWVGHQQRQFDPVRAAKRALAGGDLGAPLLYVDQRFGDYSPGRPGWLFDPATAGGGIAMNLGVHTIDRAGWLLDARPVSVAGRVAVPTGYAVETGAAGVLTLSDGTKVDFALLHRPDDYRHDTHVICEGGHLELTAASAAIVEGSGRRVLVEVDADAAYTESFARQYRALVRTLRDGEPPAVTPAEARATVAAVRALYDSAAAGGVLVPIDG